ncbi:glycosyltransferase family 2 protein [Acaryochloris marina]|uniref:glycosyltransferase family 2 protein n=1 Tax=Acaryochloris marina TaxID=155978 RepID=UPI002016DB4A|nr:glycosyltransferase family 2 protein [Acaryochloris marina]QUY40605.1 glycosyltransferase [Acaryochloris marina S15]
MTVSKFLTIKDLPPPPPNKKGWPWTEGSNIIPEIMLDGLTWPKISIITPSFNQGKFLEETIRSVLLQGYPNLEYILMDGGSTDNSLEIINKYEEFFTYWTSKNDKGQSHAINSGFNQAKGKICAWLNSDDCYCPNILSNIANEFRQGKNIRCITCSVERVTPDNNFICLTNPPSTKFSNIFWWSYYVPQAGVFFNHDLFIEAGKLDESLHLQMDYDLWFRFSEITNFHHYEIIASKIKIHNNAKTTSPKYKILSKAEAIEVKLRYANTGTRKKILEEIARRITYCERKEILGNQFKKILKRFSL